MHDNNLIPACTLIVGAPEETEDDVVKTIELMDDLKEIRSLIVPLFFLPMGMLKDEEWLKDTEMNELHRELLIKCLDHDLYWIDHLIGLAFAEKWYSVPLRAFNRLFVKIIRFKAKEIRI